MSGLGAAGLSAGGDLAGSVVTGMFNASQSAKGRHWQEKMYDQRHQREVNDLRAAGLNPVLSAMGSPGSAGGAPVATMPDLGGIASKGVSTAIAAKAAKAELVLREKEARSKELDVSAKERMYEWLDKNPGYKDLIYAGMLSTTAGMSGNVMAPVMAWNSASVAAKVRTYVDKVAEWMRNYRNKGVETISPEEIRRKFGKPKGGEEHEEP